MSSFTCVVQRYASIHFTKSVFTFYNRCTTSSRVQVSCTSPNVHNYNTSISRERRMNNVHLPVANRRRKHGGEGKVAPLDFWLN